MMKLHYNILAFLCLCVISCPGQELKVMTYNIRLDTPSDGENAWPHRKDMLTDQVLFMMPDVLGVQEALPHQVTDLSSALKNYEHFGMGREGGSLGEHSSIFYNTETCKVEDSGTFWLSNTPNKVSKGWDAALPRVCTYGLFSLVSNGSKFWVFNTHFDHVGQQARLESMRLILKQISQLNSDNLPVVLMGDLNVEPSSDLIQELANEMNDTKVLADIDFGSDGTFNGFNITQPAKRRIDFVFTSKTSTIQVKKYGVLSSVIDQRYPSDHFPVFVELRIN